MTNKQAVAQSGCYPTAKIVLELSFNSLVLSCRLLPVSHSPKLALLSHQGQAKHLFSAFPPKRPKAQGPKEKAGGWSLRPLLRGAGVGTGEMAHGIKEGNFLKIHTTHFWSLKLLRNFCPSHPWTKLKEMSGNPLSGLPQQKLHLRLMINRSYVTQQVTALPKPFVGHQSTYFLDFITPAEKEERRG